MDDVVAKYTKAPDSETPSSEPAAPSFSPYDQSMIVRTVIGEAGDNGAAYPGIVRDILERHRSTGAAPSDVVLSRGVYPSWDTRAKELMSIDPNSDRYKRAAAVVDQLLSGNPAPSSVPMSNTIAKYTKFSEDGGAPTAGIPAPIITQQLAAPYTPPTTLAGRLWDEFQARTLGGISRDVPKIAGGVAALPGNVLASTAENFLGGVGAVRQGAEEIRAGNVLPTFPSSDPRTWEAGGALRTVGGGLATAFSPLTAITQHAVEEPVTQLTGNPEAGSRAGIVANALLASPSILGQLNRFRPSVQATQGVSGALQATQQPSEALARLESNPRLTLADVDPTLRQRAMGIAAEPGPAKNILFQRTQERMATAPGAVREAYDETMGPAPNVPELLRSYETTAQTNAQRGFGEAFAGAKPVDITPVINLIDAKLRPGINQMAANTPGLALTPTEQRLLAVRSQLTDGRSMQTDPQRLHYDVQIPLRADVHDLVTSATGSDKAIGRALGDVQQKLIDQIDASTGGKYRPAREQFRSDKEVGDAFDKGAQILQNRQTAAGLREDTPDAWREWIGDASPEEIQAAQLGARAMVEQKIGGLRFAARQGTSLPEVDFNMQKFGMLFGTNEAARLANLLRDEKDIAATNSKLFAGSDTAERLAGREAVKVRDVNPLSYGGFLPPALAELGGIAAGLPEMGHAAALGTGLMSALRFAQGRIGRRADMARNALEAQMFLASGPERAAAINAVRAQMNRSGNPLAAAGPRLPLTYVPHEGERQ